MQHQDKGCATPQLTTFTFIPNTFRIGADPNITVITGYLRFGENTISIIKKRRTPDQLGEPTALIVAFDVEYSLLQLYCIDSMDTQCLIHLEQNETAALNRSLRKCFLQQYHDSPEHLLNSRRLRANLPPLHTTVC